MTKFEGNHYSHTKIQGNSLIGEIIETAVAGLRAMFDPGKNLFCFKRVKGENGLFNEGISLRYTIISLLGLESLEKNNLRHNNPYKSMLERLKIHLNEIDNIGDLGLLIWLYAISSPEQLFEIIDFINNTNPLERYADAIQGKTTELAWFLTGLSYAALVHGEKGDYLNELGDKTYGLIKRNYYGEGIFGHVRKSTLSGIFRARIGSFADQVYPIYAFTKFAKAYGNDEALQIAAHCGEAICKLQGEKGQWWWHYDAPTGRVIRRYPVYSVHQDGMAPMSLFALGECTGKNFAAQIFKGLEWIAGKNELEVDLIDRSNNLIWRSLYMGKMKMYSEELFSYLGISHRKDKNKDLKILFECRPYHLGWILYAFANRS